MLSSLQALDDWTFATLPSWVSTQYGKVSCTSADKSLSLQRHAHSCCTLHTWRACAIETLRRAAHRVRFAQCDTGPGLYTLGTCAGITLGSAVQVSAAAAPHVQAVRDVAQPYWDSAYETLTPHTDVAYKHGSQYASQAYKVIWLPAWWLPAVCSSITAAPC